MDIVESYKENVDGDIDYDKYKLLTINYICLTFGVVTVLLSAAFLIKFSESEDFVQFMVKWSIIRCFFVFAGIIYICIEMHHVLTISLSSVMISIDLCASAYFTGVMASYIKELEDPSGQVDSNQQRSNGEPSVYLISHKKSLHTENKVNYVSEVESPGTEGFEEIPLNGKHIETNHNLTTTSSCIKSIQKENPVSTTAIEGGDPDREFNPNLQEEKEKNDLAGSCKNSRTNCVGQGGNSEPGKNASSSDLERNSEINDQNSGNLINNESLQSDVIAAPEVSDHAQTECEKQERDCENEEYQDTQLPENSSDVERLGENPTVLSEKSSDERGIENIAVNVIGTEPPSVVVIPASPDEEFGLQFKKDDNGTVNLGFDTVEMKSTDKE